MRKVGDGPPAFYCTNTLQYKGRVFNFAPPAGKLRVTEMLLGEKSRYVVVATNALRKEYEDEDERTACCLLGQHILLLTRKNEGIFAALVDIDDGPLTNSTIHFTELFVWGDKEWPDSPFLCSVSDSRALLYFFFDDRMWYCDLDDHILTVRNLKTKMPTSGGFCTVPIRLPNGKLLVAGALPYSKSITLISCEGKLAFEKIGDIPGRERCLTSIALIGGRFVIGFGGVNTDIGVYLFSDLWIFDLETRLSSPVRRRGDWREGDCIVPMMVQDDNLYFVGAGDFHPVYVFPLRSLANLIKDKTIRSTFSDWLGTTFQPFAGLETEMTKQFVPGWL